jgi:hypothetical protein
MPGAIRRAIAGETALIATGTETAPLPILEIRCNRRKLR